MPRRKRGRGSERRYECALRRPGRAARGAAHPSDGLGGAASLHARCGADGAGIGRIRCRRLHPRPGAIQGIARAIPMNVPFLSLTAIHEELGAQLDDAYRRVMRSGWYILGEEVEAFEERFARFCGARHCVGVANGLDALSLALRAWDIGAGDEVIVPSNTYIASWLAASHVGATPVAVEPDLATYNIDPNRIEDAITPRTRAILPVHLYGQAADMDPIREIGKRRGLRVLEDAAQAAGALYRGRRAGALGDAAGFSFYPTKNLGAYGDAGALVTDDEDLARRGKGLRNYGSRTRYVNDVIGYNSRLDPMQAALLGPRLAVLDEWNARRRLVAQRYLTAFKDTPLILPATLAGNEHTWHLFVVRSQRRQA